MLLFLNSNKNAHVWNRAEHLFFFTCRAEWFFFSWVKTIFFTQNVDFSCFHQWIFFLLHEKKNILRSKKKSTRKKSCAKKIFFTWLDKWNFPFFKIWGFFSPIKKKFHVARHMNFFFPSAIFFSLFHYKKNFLNFFHSTWHMKKKFTVTHIKEHFISK